MRQRGLELGSMMGFVLQYLAIVAVGLAAVASGLGSIWLSPTPIPVSEDQLYVTIAPPRQKEIDWGSGGNGYEKAVGNLLVHYGGANAKTLAAVKVAVAALPR